MGTDLPKMLRSDTSRQSQGPQLELRNRGYDNMTFFLQNLPSQLVTRKKREKKENL